MKNKNKIYENLVQVYYADLYRYAVWLTNNKAISEDILQETFLKAWNKLESLEDINKAKSWLITILRRENFRRLEKHKETEELNEESSIIEDEIENNIEIIELRQAINKLTVEYKEPLMLQIIQGFSVKEISDILDINENTVLTRLFRAKKQLKEKLHKTEEKKWMI